MEKSPKSKNVALILSVFGGYFGAHQFYVGKIGMGVLYLFTFGVFGIMWIVDIFKILFGKFKDNNNLLIDGFMHTDNTDKDNITTDYNNEAHVKFRVAGVTFKNGRKSRQAILRKIKWKDEPFDGIVIYTLQVYEYEGRPTVGIYANGEQIGNVPKEHTTFVVENINKIKSVSVEVYGGGKTKSGEQKSFGAEVTLVLYE